MVFANRLRLNIERQVERGLQVFSHFTQRARQSRGKGEVEPEFGHQRSPQIVQARIAKGFRSADHRCVTGVGFRRKRGCRGN